MAEREASERVARWGVEVRSYRAVVDEVERRIFRVDRWRLPTPHGVSVRAIVYALACVGAILVASGVPVLGALVGELPASVRYLALPAVGGWALSAWRIDGRAPHRTLAAAVRFAASGRTLAGVRPCPAVGTELSPVEAIEVAPSGDEPRLRRGRVRGPALVGLRYPARVAFDGAKRAGDLHARLAGARHVRISAMAGEARALARGRVLRVPARGEVELG